VERINVQNQRIFKISTTVQIFLLNFTGLTSDEAALVKYCMCMYSKPLLQFTAWQHSHS